MADSSPSLQNTSSNFLAELGPTSPETHSGNNLAASQHEASARLASEFLSGKAPVSSVDGGGLSRAATVLGGGLVDGVVESAEHSLNWHTAKAVAESLGVGYGLGALAKAGPIGQKIAMAGGLIMGASWVYSEIERGRPQATWGAVADAYKSKDHMAQDRQTVATNGGALAFETGLAVLAGGVGMKKGLELNTNWHVDAIAGVKSTYGSAVDFIARDGRINGAHVLGADNLGVVFAGKDAMGPAAVMDMAKDIISGKAKSATSLNDIQETFHRSQAQKNDAQLLDGRNKIVDLEAQHAQIKADETALAPKLNKAVKDKVELDNFSNLEQTIRIRQQALADAQQAGRDIPGKKRELDKLFAEKQLAFEKQKPKDGVPAEPALRDEFQRQHREFEEQKAKFGDIKNEGSPESIQSHRESLEEAQRALQQARLDQPAKIAQAQNEIEGLNEKLTALRTRRLAIEGEVKPLVDAYNTRLDLVTKDPTKLVQAQFEPPVQKIIAAKTTVSPKVELGNGDLGNVDVKPTAAELITRSVSADKASPFEQIVAEAQPALQEKAVIVPHTAEATVPAIDAKVPVKEVASPAFESNQTNGRTLADHPQADQTSLAGRSAVQERRVSDTTIDRDRGADVTDGAGIGRLSKEAQASREVALKAVKSNELVRERDTATKVLADIERGAYKPINHASVAEVKLEMERRLTAVNEKLKGDPGIKYTRALKSVLQYSRSVGKQLAETSDIGQRGGISEQALTDIEGMMGRLPTSYKGYQGKLPDLTEPSRLGRNGSPERRFADVSEHLEGKVALLDGSRARQLADVAERQPTLNEIIRRMDTAALPEDGSIILIGKDGKYLGPQGGTSPYFIEVARMKAHGVGADGGGFYRFEKIQNDIAGAVVLRPIYENGKPVELPNRSSAGKPVYKKTVAETFGTVPDGIKPDLNFVDILRKFAPAR